MRLYPSFLIVTFYYICTVLCQRSPDCSQINCRMCRRDLLQIACPDKCLYGECRSTVIAFNARREALLARRNSLTSGRSNPRENSRPVQNFERPSLNSGLTERRLSPADLINLSPAERRQEVLNQVAVTQARRAQEREARRERLRAITGTSSRESEFSFDSTPEEQEVVPEVQNISMTLTPFPKLPLNPNSVVISRAGGQQVDQDFWQGWSQAPVVPQRRSQDRASYPVQFEQSPVPRQGTFNRAAFPAQFGQAQARPGQFGQAQSRPGQFGLGQSRPAQFGQGQPRPGQFGQGQSRSAQFGQSLIGQPQPRPGQFGQQLIGQPQTLPTQFGRSQGGQSQSRQRIAPSFSGRQPTSNQLQHIGDDSCRNADFQPCISRQEANARVLTCCRQKNLGPGCIPLCNYETNRRQIQRSVLGDECALEDVGKVLKCGAGGQDARSCCRSKGILDGNKKICEPFCNPEGGLPSPTPRYLRCGNQLSVIADCFHALQPTIQQKLA